MVSSLSSLSFCKTLIFSSCTFVFCCKSSNKQTSKQSAICSEVLKSFVSYYVRRAKERQLGRGRNILLKKKSFMVFDELKKHYETSYTSIL